MTHVARGDRDCKRDSERQRSNALHDLAHFPRSIADKTISDHPMAGFLALRCEMRCKRLGFTIRDWGVESSGSTEGKDG
jgi:hypothetical protein